MCSQTNGSSRDDERGRARAAANDHATASTLPRHEQVVKTNDVLLVYFTTSLFFLDVIVAMLFMSPLVPWIYHEEHQNFNKYSFSGALTDLLVLSVARIALAVSGFLFSYFQGSIRVPYGHLELYHSNGTEKTKEELEEEALEQSFFSWLRRYVRRVAFPCEFLSFLSALVVIAKCLARLKVEIGLKKEADSSHPLFWCTLLLCSVLCILEIALVDPVCVRLGEWGHMKKAFLRQNVSQLDVPLLADDELQYDNATNAPDEEGQRQNQNQGSLEDDENALGISDITGDSEYKASWSDLLHLCAPDSALIAVAFIFLLSAAAAQIYIPHFTGAILDALAEAYGKQDHNDVPIEDVPGFMSNVRKLVSVSILGGVFSGVRGSIFTIVGGRVNVRLRLRQMDALLTMEQGFFDVTKTGDITSRLSSDTTLVGDQVTLNVNVSKIYGTKFAHRTTTG